MSAGGPGSMTMSALMVRSSLSRVYRLLAVLAMG